MRGSEDHDGIRREIEDLNGHFLNLTAAATFGAPAFGLTPDLLDRLRNLAPERTARLANCPFALFELSTAVNAEKTNPPGLLHRLREGPEPADSVVRFTLLALAVASGHSKPIKKWAQTAIPHGTTARSIVDSPT